MSDAAASRRGRHEDAPMMSDAEMPPPSAPEPLRRQMRDYCRAMMPSAEREMIETPLSRHYADTIYMPRAKEPSAYAMLAAATPIRRRHAEFSPRLRRASAPMMPPPMPADAAADERAADAER